MRQQDFMKLIGYVQEKQASLNNSDRLFSCTVSIKNDPKECIVHVSNEDNVVDYTFFDHDDYTCTKYHLDELLSLK